MNTTPNPSQDATTGATAEAYLEAAQAQRAHGPDVMAVIGLHIQASQALQRCASELATPDLSYEQACRHVDKAAELLHALHSIEVINRARNTPKWED